MPETAAKILHHGFHFFVIVLLFSLAILIIAAIIARMYQPRYDRWKKPFKFLCLSPLAIFIVFVLSVYLWIDHSANAYIDSLADAPPAQIEFTRSASHFLIEDPQSIHDLLLILRNARQVASHHSRLIKPPWEFSLPAAGYRFAISADSDRLDEYHLTWLSYPGSDPSLPRITTFRQFHSNELTAWLNTHLPAPQPAH